MKDYHSNVYIRILDIISLLLETDSGVTISNLAKKYDVGKEIILEDIRYICKSEELNISILPCEEELDTDDFLQELMDGKRDDIEIYSENNSFNNQFSIQLSAFEKVFLSSFLKKSGIEHNFSEDMDIYVKKMYNIVSIKVLEVLKDINEAIKKEQNLEIVYWDKQEYKKKIKIMPIKVIKMIANEVFYLLAISNSEIVSLQIDNIIEMKICMDSKIAFEKKKVEDILSSFDYRWGLGEMEKDEVPFEFEMIVYEEANLPKRLFTELQYRKYGVWEKLDVDKYIYRDMVMDYNSLRAWVMSLGSSVKVIKPKRLVMDIVESAKIRKRYYSEYIR